MCTRNRHPLPFWLASTLIAWVPIAAPTQADAQVPRHTVGGRVVGVGTATPLEGVTVELRGIAERITDERGAFSFEDVPSGGYTLRARALGYRTRDIALTLASDTTLEITLAVDPVLLDSIRADARFIDLRGTVTDRAADRAIQDATVYHSPDRNATTNLGGSFRIRRMPEGVPTVIAVTALGYLPARLTVIPESGRRIEIALDVDSVGQRMIERQVDRLETRINAIAAPLTTVGREALLRHPALTAGDIVRRRLPYNRAIQCLIVDERPFLGGDLLAVLDSYYADEIERIEILARGAMVRVYTRRFIQRMIRGAARIPPIVWGFGGCH